MDKKALNVLLKKIRRDQEQLRKERETRPEPKPKKLNNKNIQTKRESP